MNEQSHAHTLAAEAPAATSTQDAWDRLAALAFGDGAPEAGCSEHTHDCTCLATQGAAQAVAAAAAAAPAEPPSAPVPDADRPVDPEAEPPFIEPEPLPEPDRPVFPEPEPEPTPPLTGPDGEPEPEARAR